MNNNSRSLKTDKRRLNSFITSKLGDTEIKIDIKEISISPKVLYKIQFQEFTNFKIGQLNSL